MQFKGHKPEVLTILYDGGCYLCRIETAFFEKKDQENALKFIDTSLNIFNASDWGLEDKFVLNGIHVRDSRGYWYTGVDAFVIISRCLDVYHPLAELATNRFSRPVVLLTWALSRMFVSLPVPKIFLKKFQGKMETCQNN